MYAWKKYEVSLSFIVVHPPEHGINQLRALRNTTLVGNNGYLVPYYTLGIAEKCPCKVYLPRLA